MTEPRPLYARGITSGRNTTEVCGIHNRPKFCRDEANAFLRLQSIPGCWQSHYCRRRYTLHLSHRTLNIFAAGQLSRKQHTHTHTTSFGTSTLKYYLYGRSYDKFRLRTAGTGITSTCLARVLHPLLCIILTYTTGTLCRRFISFISNKKVTQ